MDEDNGFEKIPNTKAEISGEQAQRAEKWEAAMQDDVPEFRGDKFGVANAENEYYGEAVADEAEEGEEYDEGIADAAELINYGVNAAVRDLGVENVVQRIKSFDASGSEDPIKDLFAYLGVDSPEEKNEIQEEEAAAAVDEMEFRDSVNAPSTHQSAEGALQVLNDMKELISEVEGADPRYESLRAGAKAAGMGYFEYAVDGFGVRGLPELFRVLAEQREQFDENGSGISGESTAGNGGLAGENDNSMIGGVGLAGTNEETMSGGASLIGADEKTIDDDAGLVREVDGDVLGGELKEVGLGEGANVIGLSERIKGDALAAEGASDDLNNLDGSGGLGDDLNTLSGDLDNALNGAGVSENLDRNIINSDNGMLNGASEGGEQMEREVIESALRNGMSEKEIADYLKNMEK